MTQSRMSDDDMVLSELVIQQIEGEPRRRWFADTDVELIAWFGERSHVIGFQFCYDIGQDKRAVTWTEDRGLVHERVDTGDDVPTKSRTPILLPDRPWPIAEIRARFERASTTLDATIRDFVLQKLR